MNLDDFAVLTQRVIAREGFEDFQPTACLPARRSVRTLAGVPDSENVEAVTLKWASEIADPGEEFLVAFKVSNAEFKIVRSFQGRREVKTYGVAQQALQADAAAPRDLSIGR